MSISQKLRRRIPILVLLACLLIGTLAGKIFGNLTAGILIGLGAGLILSGLLRFILFKRPIEKNTKGETTGD